jgi:hypothetical protein
MKKKQDLINEWKLKSRRKIMPGFPVEKPFNTREEMEAYLNSDKLLCLLCGKSYKSLCAHLLVHGTNADQYKEKYGLPWGCGLTCTSTKEMNIRHGKKLVAEGIFTPPSREKLKVIMKNRAKQRKKPKFIIEECKARISSRKHLKVFLDVDYFKILELAEKNRCHPTDICRKNKKNVPGISMLHAYKKNNFDYKKKYNQIINSLPKEIKIKHGLRGNKYEEQIKKLKKEYKTNAEIASILGVHEITIEKYNKKYGIKKPNPITCKSGLHPYPGLKKRCQPCGTIASRKYNGTMDKDISKNIIIDRCCSDCGVTTQVKRIYGIIKPSYCKSCKKKRLYDSQRKYSKKRLSLKNKVI